MTTRIVTIAALSAFFSFGGLADAPSFEHFAVPAMSEIRRLPDARPTDVAPGGVVRIVAARDEFEPGSFVVKAERDLGKVRLALTPLVNERGVAFPAEDLDLKVIKVWYQNRNGWYSYFGDTGFALCPELLLNDEDLIRVDTKKAANYARLTEKDGTVHERWINPPRQMDVRESKSRPWDVCETFWNMKPNFTDAKTLQPVLLEKGVYRQFFLTAHVRRNAKPGLYRGEVKVGTFGSVPVELRVLDFELPQPKCMADPEKDFLVSSYAYISYGIVMDNNGQDLELARRQIRATLKDQFEHNQTMHGIRCTAMKEESNFTWDMVREVGMRSDVIMGYMYPGADPKRAAAYIDARFGHHNIYMGYGDEPGSDWLEQARPVYEKYQREGFRFFIAGSDSVFHKAGYLYDWHNIAKPPTDDTSTRLWNMVDGGNHVAWYANHHIGPENPAFNRRQNGLGAWLAGYTALCNYAHHYGPYNDDRTTYKPMVFAYGTGDGVIDTLGWEGFREGLDDIRYATLLTAYAREAQKSSDIESRYLGGKALGYLASVNRDDCDQDAVRYEMVNFLLALQAKKVKNPLPKVPVVKPFKPSVEPKPSAECLAELAKATGKDAKDLARAQAAVYDKYFLYEAGTKTLEKAGLLQEIARRYAGEMHNDPVRAEKAWLEIIAATNIERFAKGEALVALLPKHPELAPMIPEFYDKGVRRPGWPDTNVVLRAYAQILGNRQSRVFLCEEAFAAHKAFYRAYRGFAAAAKAPIDPNAAARAVYMGALAGDTQLAQTALSDLAANPKAPTNDVYLAKLFVVAPSFGTVDDVRAFDSKEGKAIAMKDKVKAVERAGSVAQRRANEALVRTLDAFRKSLYRPEPKVCYDVQFSETPLRDLEHWTGLSVKPVKFVYERKYGGSTDFMVTDVSTGNRGAGDSGEKLENPWMEVVADAWGLHFRFTTPDPKAREVELGLAGGGSYEGYIAPGEGEPYVCVMMEPGKEKPGFFNTMYDTFGHRRLDPANVGKYRFQTFYTDDKVVSCLSLSWETYAERIPTDGKTWDFENMRWTRSGNFCFNGTESIHGRSTWGLLRFHLTDAQRAKILRPLLFKAHREYLREVRGGHGYEGAVAHWRDTAVGDTRFYMSELKPLVESFKADETLLKADISDADVLRLAERALPTWRNIRYEVGRRRAAFLAAELVNPPPQKFTLRIENVPPEGCSAGPNVTPEPTKTGLYARGEKPSFRILAFNDGKPAPGAQVALTYEQPGRAPTEFTVVTDEKGELVKTFEAPRQPGWVKVEGRLGRAKAVAGAICDGEHIRASMGVPGDFRKFWDAEIAALKKVPFTNGVKLVEQKVDPKFAGKVKTWEFEIPCVGPRPATGYLSMPVGAKPKSLPIIVAFQGASGISAWRSDYYGEVAISLSASKFGLPNGLTQKEYEAKGFYASDVKGFASKGLEKRETAFFKWMILRDLRILEYAKTRPEWNGDLVILNGESLGGAQALCVGALDPDVDFVSALVPALSDHNGRRVGRHNGWPHLWKPDENGRLPAEMATVAENARYVDAANFCTLYTTNKEVSVSTGFADTTCPPDGVFADFNNLPKGMTKTLWTNPPEGHGAGNRHAARRLKELLGK